MALRNRKEMDPEFQWRLSDIYPTMEAWETAYAQAKTQVEALSELPGTLSRSKEDLKAGLDRIYAAAEPVERLYLYANLYKCGDNGDPDAQALEGRAMNLYVALSAALSFVDPEILTIPEETLRAWMADPMLADYRHIIEDTDRNRAHTLSAEQEKIYSELSFFAPDPVLIDVFKVRYDYHNAKVLLKSEAQGIEADELLLDLGRVPARELREKLLASDFRGMPPVLQEAIQEARDTLGTTKDPQISDLVLDRACYEDMFAIAEAAGSDFLAGYVRISIDAANLRSAVRAGRMGKGTEFLKPVLFEGGNIDVNRVLAAAGAGGSLPDLYALSMLKEAAEAGADALEGGRLTDFERLCDNAVNDYLKTARLVPFGDAPVVAYLAAKENEFTAIRILLTGKLAGLEADTIRERLRDAYV